MFISEIFYTYSHGVQKFPLSVKVELRCCGHLPLVVDVHVVELKSHVLFHQAVYYTVFFIVCALSITHHLL